MPEPSAPSPGEVWNVLITEDWAPEEATPCLILAVHELKHSDTIVWQCLMCVTTVGRLVNERVCLSYDRRLTRRSEL